MNFLLVNDDGIHADGIKALAKAMSEVGDVYVCAPSTQQSGKSHSITLDEEIFVRPIEFPCAKMAWMVSGTPSDCTKLGIQMCEANGIELDIVYSGINMGSNLGTDTVYSGTVGAALEATMRGYKAVAVSVNDRDSSHFDGACRAAIALIDYAKNELAPKTILNINSPNKPVEELKGIKLSKLGPGYFNDGFVHVEDDRYKLKGHIPDHKENKDDVDVFHNACDYITITPLRVDLTDYDELEKLMDWRIDI